MKNVTRNVEYDSGVCVPRWSQLYPPQTNQDGLPHPATFHRAVISLDSMF